MLGRDISRTQYPTLIYDVAHENLKLAIPNRKRIKFVHGTHVLLRGLSAALPPALTSTAKVWGRVWSVVGMHGSGGENVTAAGPCRKMLSNWTFDSSGSIAYQFELSMNL